MNLLKQSLGYGDIEPVRLNKVVSVACTEPGDSLAKATITDGVAAFYSDSEENIKKLVVKIKMTQSGEGMPSPANIRPISGWTGAIIIVSPTTDAQDGTSYPVEWQSEAGTVYGGTLNVTTGLLSINKVGKIFNGSERGWIDNGAYGVAYPLSEINGNVDLTKPAITDYLTAIQRGPGSGLGVWQCRYNTNGTHFLVRGDGEAIASVAAWTAYLTEHPLTVLFSLSSPITYQLTPTEVTTLLGTNNIWADCGPITEVLY